MSESNREQKQGDETEEAEELFFARRPAEGRPPEDDEKAAQERPKKNDHPVTGNSVPDVSGNKTGEGHHGEEQKKGPEAE